jgi:uncharacterized protein involved in response to NO
LTASLNISMAYGTLIVAAIVRPFAEVFPEAYHLLLAIAGVAWKVALGLFLAEYGPILLRRGR